MQYWNDQTTEKSWDILQQIKGKFKFILIGGWAVYLWTKTAKSKDIDIIIDFNTLSKLKQEYQVNKNTNLKKYEIKIDNIDIDIYLKFFSELTIPAQDIQTTEIEGFETPKIEELIILKQGAELDRRKSEKGEKDRIDIFSLLFNCSIDFKRYLKILKQSNLTNYFTNLTSLIRSSNPTTQSKYLSLTPREFKLKKQELLDRLRKIR
ncbi:MAG: hypothetical protein KKG60_00795 [Nanoarchaeota archaeon]|nr:hypothetical protein [Nanoarchaeota archaeon]